MKNTKLKSIIIILILLVAVVCVCIYVSKHKPEINTPVTNLQPQDPQLIGDWRGDHEENPGFEIKADGVYGADEIPSKYVVDDSRNITIYYTGFVFTGKYKVENNKLYLTSGGNTDIYSRWCPEKNDICS